MDTTRRWPGFTVDELTLALGSRTRALEAVRWFFSVEGPPPEELPERLPGVSHRRWGPHRAGSGVVRARVTSRACADDGTVKYAVALDGLTVETVRIPSRARSTVCVSSQAGCTRRCAFCATKELGFLRALRAEEMVAQYLLVRRDAPPEAPARNVVFMGMGEPLDNLDEVLRAVQVLTQGPLPQLRASSVTVSTAGVVPGMRRFLRESRASLALSLNATTDAVRERLMPHARTWPIADLLAALREGLAVDPRRQYFVGYVLFDGVNDSDADADRLAELLVGLPARVNLIPWNPWPGSTLRTSPDERVLAFHARAMARGQQCLVRWPRGRRIAAACGQLALGWQGAPVDPPSPLDR